MSSSHAGLGNGAASSISARRSARYASRSATKSSPPSDEGGDSGPPGGEGGAEAGGEAFGASLGGPAGGALPEMVASAERRGLSGVPGGEHGGDDPGAAPPDDLFVTVAGEGTATGLSPVSIRLFGRRRNRARSWAAGEPGPPPGGWSVCLSAESGVGGSEFMSCQPGLGGCHVSRRACCGGETGRVFRMEGGD